MDQPNGQAICQKMGGNLASIHDNGTHEFIGALTRPSYDMAYQLKWPILRAFWIGKFEFRINSLLFNKIGMQRKPAGDGSGTYKCEWSDGTTSVPEYACPLKPNPRPGDPKEPNPVFPWAPGQPCKNL
jgi:hypothetical protein